MILRNENGTFIWQIGIIVIPLQQILYVELNSDAYEKEKMARCTNKSTKKFG